MEYDIIFITGDLFFDHPLCGVAILKRLLEKKGFRVGVIEKPQTAKEVTRLGRPKLFFGVGSGPFDSMVCNYTPLKKKRDLDSHSKYSGGIKDRAVIVYCNWIRENFKDSKLVLGGTESSLRRFTQYDYWDNDVRKPILADTRADILSYGNSEKQVLEIANRIKSGTDLFGILGTCVISREEPSDMTKLPSYEEVIESKERYVDMQNLFNNYSDMYQQVGKRFFIQFKSPKYTTQDLDYYYGFDFSREVPLELRGFQFSITTHRGCVGDCSFCSVTLLQGDKIISRSEESVLAEIKAISKHPKFRGSIDDLGGPSANMYGMDCGKCNSDCMDCTVLDLSHNKIISLMEKARAVPGVSKVNIRSGIRFDQCNEAYLNELNHHIPATLRIAPEHVSHNVLKLMNKDKGDIESFQDLFKKCCPGKNLSYYFITAHPGSTMKEAKDLGKYLKNLENSESVQIFTPTPMSNSTCMYYTGLDLQTKEKIYVPYSYKEKKDQKRVIFD